MSNDNIRVLGSDLHPRATVHLGHGAPLGQGTPSQQILDPLGPEYTHRAKVHLTQQIFHLRHTLLTKS